MKHPMKSFNNPLKNIVSFNIMKWLYTIVIQRKTGTKINKE